MGEHAMGGLALREPNALLASAPTLVELSSTVGCEDAPIPLGRGGCAWSLPIMGRAYCVGEPELKGRVEEMKEKSGMGRA